MTRFFGGMFGVALIAAVACIFKSAELMKVKGSTWADVVAFYFLVLIAFGIGAIAWKFGEAIFSRAEKAQ